MDTLDDNEIESIWDRVKKHIATDRIKGKNQEEVLSSIREMMGGNEGAGDSRGSMNNLLRNGFLTEKVFPSSRTFKDASIREWVSLPSRDGVKEVHPLSVPSVRERAKGKIAVKTKKGTRVYSKKNLRFSFSEGKDGKRRFYVYNSRLRKRVTWGFV